MHHVIPEFYSPIPWLRYRACWIVEYFPTLKFSTPGIIQGLTQGLLAGLRDAASPVQAASACSLRILMDSEETTEILRPSVHLLIG
jgi:importin-7